MIGRTNTPMIARSGMKVAIFTLGMSVLELNLQETTHSLPVAFSAVVGGLTVLEE